MKRALLFWLLSLPTCMSQTPKVGFVRHVDVVTGKPKQAGKPRLGWISWESSDTLIYCNRRIDDQGNAVGNLGPCSSIKPDNVPHRMLSWLNTESPDTSPADQSPFTECSLKLEDAVLAPSPKPARLTLETPSGPRLLHTFSPGAGDEGDAFHIETSFSPDGKLLAIIEVSVGLGEGERAVEIRRVRLIDAPTCP